MTVELDNGKYKLFAKMINQYKKPENGLAQLFTVRPENIFGGSKITYDLQKFKRLLPEPKLKGAGFTTIETNKFRTIETEPPEFKERVNYSICETSGRFSGTLTTDDIDKTLLLMSKTAQDLTLILDSFELGMILQAAEILQYGKIRYTSQYSYTVPDYDFQSPAGHFVDVTTSWASGGGDPIGDIENHCALIRKEGRARVDNLIFGRAALTGFLQNDRVRAELDNRRIDRGNLAFENVQMNGFARLGIYNFDGVILTMWTYDEYYEDSAGDATDYIEPNYVVFFASQGIYDRYFAGVDIIKNIPENLMAFLPSPNITIIGDRVATDVYIDTKEVDDGDNAGVYLRGATKPLCVPSTPDTFGRLNVIV